jgi:hypothetical protein
MMTRAWHVLGVFSAVVLMAGAGGLRETAAQEPEPTPTSEQEAKEDDQQPREGLHDDVVGLLDLYSIDDLRQLLFNAENALSFDGRRLIRHRSDLKRIIKEVQPILKRYEEDGTFRQRVDGVKVVMDDQAVRAEIEGYLELDDEEFEKKFDAFLNDQGWSDEQIDDYATWHDAKEAFAEAEVEIDVINGKLTQPVPKVEEPSSPEPGPSRLEQVRRIRSQVEGEQRGAVPATSGDKRKPNRRRAAERLLPKAEKEEDKK